MAVAPAKHKSLEENLRDGAANEPAPKSSLIGSFLNKALIEPDFWTALTHLNLFFGYVVILSLLAGYHLNYYYLAIYLPVLFFLDVARKGRKERIRLEIAHSIPFFADALANSLSAGATLEQAFKQGLFFLKGEIKTDFNKLIIKNALGENLGVLLRELDAKYPNTGLMYLISLLDAYGKLGVGISPLLKRIAVILTEKEKAEEKIRIILAAGSSYARLTIGIFGAIFLALSYLMKEQVHALFALELRPMFIFLVAWMCMGILIVTRITSLGFTRSFALKPYIVAFMSNRKLDLEDLLTYSGLKWTGFKRQMLLYAPVFVGLYASYVMSWYADSVFMIEVGFAIGTILGWLFLRFVLNGLVEDQLIKAVEIFPEILQVFIIGLNAGLNAYLAFEFAQNAIKGEAPRVLAEELRRTRLAMDCGEDHTTTWRRLAHRLPFETVIDFAKIMIIAPMHGESIVNSISQMTTGYQEKKLLMVEKKATAISQVVIPIIIMAFLPVFLFVMFAPLISKIKLLID